MASAFDTIAKEGESSKDEKKQDIHDRIRIQTASQFRGTRPWKVLVEGRSGSGKSDFIATMPEWYIANGVDPDDILILVADLDDGIAPLFEQERTPYDLQDRIEIAVCTNFDDWLDVYEYFLDRLKRWKEDRGVMGTFAIDNLGKMWEWARSSYAEKSYGMTMRDLLLMRRRAALESNKRNLPVFDQMVDYGVINPYHNDPLEQMKLLSNQYFNYVWTAPVKEYDGRLVTQGQWENEFRVDFRVQKYREGEGDDAKFLADLVKFRGQSRGFSRLTNPTFQRFTKAIARIRELEAQERRVKGLTFKKPEVAPELQAIPKPIQSEDLTFETTEVAEVDISLPPEGGAFGDLASDMGPVNPKETQAKIDKQNEEGDLEW